MKWGWRQTEENTWTYPGGWQVCRNWAAEEWYIVRDGKWAEEAYTTAAAAIEAAEKEMEK
jgi:hypothetical protein